jgi:bifunctional DNA-binding transcriptional regulator/antitoxin component of YhaV-PrlF toxin-antitoxin module
MNTFQATIEQFNDTRLWSHHFKIEPAIARKFIEGKNRRVLCSINGEEAFQCAIMRGANDLYFINVNKEIRNKLGLLEGEMVKVKLEKDQSEFGLPFPEAFQEVLDSDPEARKYFDSLTAGRKRNLLYIVNKPKSVDKQIEKSLVIAQHFKKMNGKIDFKLLNEDFRNFSF